MHAKEREGDQVRPTVSDRVESQTLVIADIHARREVGISRYGTALQAFNGRDTILDAYEEALDLTVYLRSLLEMRNASRDDLVTVVVETLAGLMQEDTFTIAQKVVDAILDAVVTTEATRR